MASSNQLSYVFTCGPKHKTHPAEMLLSNMHAIGMCVTLQLLGWCSANLCPVVKFVHFNVNLYPSVRVVCRTSDQPDLGAACNLGLSNCHVHRVKNVPNRFRYNKLIHY